ncbi:nitroreductase [Lachnotalea glycerini]|uniref:Nitroreductase n=1 Tax=Lachnotalea glycerini TaxID=1763509 RepID=A0A318EWH2_9FIRM|nr:nitroreductase family protein [Lachnotalea glycerini]PXV95597.1 nitroreductase [Lachnotalea glycerini]
MELYEAILGRKSIRSFEDKKIEKEKLEFMIQMATYAPSASNRQAWKFIEIDDIDLKEKICNNNGGGIQYGKNLIMNAPTGILVLYRNDVSKNCLIYKDHIQSASAAIQNMLLTAYEMGIGTCWVCKLPKPSYLKKIMDIPRCYDIIGYIAMGYPKDYISEHTVKHYNGDVNQALSRVRKYSVKCVLSKNKLNDKECLDAFKYPKVLFVLQSIQLNFSSGYNQHKMINKLLERLIIYFANKKL